MMRTLVKIIRKFTFQFFYDLKRFNFYTLTIHSKKASFFQMLMIGLLSAAVTQAAVNEAKEIPHFEAIQQQYDSVHITQPQKGLELARQMVLLSANMPDSAKKALALFDLGYSQYIVGDYEKSKIKLTDAADLYAQLKDHKGLCLSYKWLGTALKALNDKEKAVDYYKKALDIAEKQHFDTEINRIENNIGILYLENGHYEKAITYFKQSAENAMDIRDKTVALSNVGLSYQKLKDFDQAEAYYEKCMQYCGQQSTNQEECRMRALEGFAGIAVEQKAFDKALVYTKDIQKYQETRQLMRDLLITYNRIGLIYDGKGDLKKAITYFYKSIAIADSLQSPQLPYLYANLSAAYENAGEYKNSLTYNTVFHEKKDSVDQLRDKMELEKLLADYEFEKKEQEITLLKKESELQASQLINRQNEIRRQEFIRNIIIASTILLALIAFIAFRIYRQKIKDKEALALKNEELNKQQTLELLREYELKTIRASLDGQEKEKKRIAEDLHDNVAGTLAAIKLKLQKAIPDRDKHPLGSLLAQIDNVYNEVRTLSHHLTPEKATMGSYIDFLDHYLKNMQEISDFKIHFFADGESYMPLLSDGIKIELYRVIQEALQNAAKHAYAQNMDIQLMISASLINLIIEDDGVGFDPEERPSGIGLRNMTNRVKKLEGSLHIDTYPKRGTIINIDIPLSTTSQPQHHSV